jgi:5'/3'-nucleotidase SurE
MRILVSNDDGVYRPGIALLAEVASEFGTVRVVAPDVERSSMSHAITASRPLSSISQPGATLAEAKAADWKDVNLAFIVPDANCFCDTFAA